MAEKICPYYQECKIAQIMSKKLDISIEKFAEIESYDPTLCPRAPEGIPAWLSLSAGPTTSREVSLVAMKLSSLSSSIEE